MTISMPRILLVITLGLLVLALVCLVAPTTIAGASWPTWLIAALISWVLDQMLGGFQIGTRQSPPPTV
jgi:hypothetical protein